MRRRSRGVAHASKQFNKFVTFVQNNQLSSEHDLYTSWCSWIIMPDTNCSSFSMVN